AKHANDATVKRGFDTIIANKNVDKALVEVQLNALSLLPEAKGTTAGKEIYADLVIGAGSKSVKWTDKKAKDNVQFLIADAAERIVRGETVDTALANANARLAKEKGVTVDLAKIKDLCK
ncbi:MAG: hypothetical protein AAB250_05970, partial [Bdellovibrionota bacterium]